MTSHHSKSPFIFFSIILLVSIAGIIHFYSDSIYFFNKKANITWEEASLKITTDWGLCTPTFPCYEIYQLDTEGGIFHGEELEGKLSEAKTKEVIRKAFNLYEGNICTPIYEDKVSENYKLNVDGKIYEFGGKKGCKEMQDIINTFKESINI